MNENIGQDIVIALEDLVKAILKKRDPVINVTPQGASVVVPPAPKCGYTITVDERDADGNIKCMTITPDYK